MPDPVHVIEGELAPCGVEYTSLFAKKAKFRFLRAGKEIAASPEIDLAGMLFKTASWKWKTPPCADDELDYVVTYKVDIDGTPIAFAQEIHVWAKDVTVTVKDHDSKATTGDVPLIVGNSASDGTVPSGGDGTVVVTMKAGQRPRIKVQRPWFARKWENEAGRKRVVEVTRGCLVKLVFPASKVTHKQWVNLDADSAKPELGSKLVVKVAAPTEKDAAPGQKVYLKAVFDAGNSARTPDSGGTEPGKDKSIEATLDDKREATFDAIELGPAGLDTIKVQVGGTPDAADDETTVVTWRKLFYELMAPDTMALDSVTLPDSSKADDLPSAIRSWFAKRLGDAGIEYALKASHRFDSKDQAVAPSIYDASYLKRTGSGKLYVVSPRKPVPATFGASDPRTVHMRLCDAAFYTAPTTQPQTKRPILTTATFDFTTFDDRLFPTSMHDGSDAIGVAGCVWTAKVNKASYPKGHPGLDDNLEPRTGSVDKAWLTAVDYATLRIALPTGSEPGSFVGALSATKCPVEIELEILTAFEINGSASGAKQLMVFKPTFPATNAGTICHELGHSMGMAVLAGSTEPPPGMTAPSEVPAGDSYSGHGHQGEHCAYGLTAKQKALTTYGGLQGTCLMYGSGPNREPPPRESLCSSCLTLLKGRRLVDIESAWEGRSGGAL
ncbi:MAG: hypothetical protein IT379_11435 [Deltaproteobacteria bacterium]|nr:hypothetical protein [Deltaproteobacteria bacterium]